MLTVTKFRIGFEWPGTTGAEHPHVAAPQIPGDLQVAGYLNNGRESWGRRPKRNSLKAKC